MVESQLGTDIVPLRITSPYRRQLKRPLRSLSPLSWTFSSHTACTKPPALYMTLHNPHTTLLPHPIKQETVSSFRSSDACIHTNTHTNTCLNSASSSQHKHKLYKQNLHTNCPLEIPFTHYIINTLGPAAAVVCTVIYSLLCPSIFTFYTFNKSAARIHYSS